MSGQEKDWTTEVVNHELRRCRDDIRFFFRKYGLMRNADGTRRPYTEEEVEQSAMRYESMMNKAPRKP